MGLPTSDILFLLKRYQAYFFYKKLLLSIFWHESYQLKYSIFKKTKFSKNLMRKQLEKFKPYQSSFALFDLSQIL
jgi:hypothetical protein